MRWPAVLAAVVTLSTAAFGDGFPIGAKVASIQVTDNSVPVTLSPASAAATVVIFISTKCPISNSYNDRMSAIYRDYSSRSVQFVFVNANANETPEEIEEHAKANQFAFKVYKDTSDVLADQFGATVTPEAYVFNREGILQYHGHVDDASNEARVQVRGLRKAIDAVLAGQPVELQKTKAFGCTIKRARKSI